MTYEITGPDALVPRPGRLRRAHAGRVRRRGGWLGLAGGLQWRASRKAAKATRKPRQPIHSLSAPSRTGKVAAGDRPRFAALVVAIWAQCGVR